MPVIRIRLWSGGDLTKDALGWCATRGLGANCIAGMWPEQVLNEFIAIMNEYMGVHLSVEHERQIKKGHQPMIDRSRKNSKHQIGSNITSVVPVIFATSFRRYPWANSHSKASISFCHSGCFPGPHATSISSVGLGWTRAR